MSTGQKNCKFFAKGKCKFTHPHDGFVHSPYLSLIEYEGDLKYLLKRFTYEQFINEMSSINDFLDYFTLDVMSKEEIISVCNAFKKKFGYKVLVQNLQSFSPYSVYYCLTSAQKELTGQEIGEILSEHGNPCFLINTLTQIVEYNYSDYPFTYFEKITFEELFKCPFKIEHFIRYFEQIISKSIFLENQGYFALYLFTKIEQSVKEKTNDLTRFLRIIITDYNRRHNNRSRRDTDRDLECSNLLEFLLSQKYSLYLYILKYSQSFSDIFKIKTLQDIFVKQFNMSKDIDSAVIKQFIKLYEYDKTFIKNVMNDLIYRNHKDLNTLYQKLYDYKDEECTYRDDLECKGVKILIDINHALIFSVISDKYMYTDEYRKRETLCNEDKKRIDIWINHVIHDQNILQSATWSVNRKGLRWSNIHEKILNYLLEPDKYHLLCVFVEDAIYPGVAIPLRNQKVSNSYQTMLSFMSCDYIQKVCKNKLNSEEWKEIEKYIEKFTHSYKLCESASRDSVYTTYINTFYDSILESYLGLTIPVDSYIKSSNKTTEEICRLCKDIVIRQNRNYDFSYNTLYKLFPDINCKKYGIYPLKDSVQQTNKEYANKKAYWNSWGSVVSFGYNILFDKKIDLDLTQQVRYE